MIAKTSGFVNGAPRVLLQAEGAAIALASIVAFSWSGASWWLFAALILAPDFSLATPVGIALALIWSAHIGIDRMLGYGLSVRPGSS
jgi:Domain of unknown function (DUF4260)